MEKLKLDRTTDNERFSTDRQTTLAKATYEKTDTKSLW